MENIVIGSISAFIISFYAMPIIIQVSKMKKLFDVPNKRKVHVTPIPSLGGLGIYIGFIFSLLLHVDITKGLHEFQYYLACFTIVAIFGLKDDILILLPMKKFLGQIMVTTILLIKGGVIINNMHGLLGIYEIPNYFSYFLTGFTIIVTMNAFNLIDGVDGLAGTLGLISTLCFATFFLLSGDLFHALIGFIFASSICAFLIFNYSPAKIFMGDTGAMMIGVINSILAIKFIAVADSYPMLHIPATPAMGFGIVLIPLMDTLRVFGNRILHGKSPFSPDRNHLHHLLLDRGLTHSQTTLGIASLQVIYIFVTYFCLSFGNTWVILFQIISFFIIDFFIRLKPVLKKVGPEHI